jgi:hypothetical protein
MSKAAKVERQASEPKWHCGATHESDLRCKREAPSKWRKWQYAWVGFLGWAALRREQCDMMPKSRTTGVREVSWRHLWLHSSLLKHVSVATNVHTTVEELLKWCFVISPWQSYIKSQWDTKNMVMGPDGAQYQEWLYWRVLLLLIHTYIIHIMLLFTDFLCSHICIYHFSPFVLLCHKLNPIFSSVLWS